jgi:hypothetical protein
MALASAVVGTDEHHTAPAEGDMILGGGRSGHYQVEVSARMHDVDTGTHDELTIDRALEDFLADCRSLLSARTVRVYESVIGLL